MEADQQISNRQPSETGSLQKAIRVLSLDGGGIRGVAVARILEEIEKETKKKIHQLFDVIVGTSTGGLLAVMMSVEIPTIAKEKPSGSKEQEEWENQTQIRESLKVKDEEGRTIEVGEVLTAAQARKLYEDKGKEIFHEKAGWFHKLLESTHHYVAKLIHLHDTKYGEGKNLQEIVKALYINNDFQQARTCTGVVVTERGFGIPLLLNSTNAKVQGYHNYYNNLSLVDLVRGTSAAPTFFKPVYVQNQNVLKSEDVAENTHTHSHAMLDEDKKFWKKEVIDHKFCKRETLFLEDGGVTCNNPSVKGFTYARELLLLHGHIPQQYQFQIYSIGTGAEQYDETDPAQEIIKELEEKAGKGQSGNWDSLRRLALDDPFNIRRQSYKNHIKVQEKLEFRERRTKIPQKYFRLQFKLDKKVLEKLDDASEKNIKDLLAAAKDCIDNNPAFKDILASLDIPVERPKDLNQAAPKSFEDSKLFQSV